MTTQFNNQCVSRKLGQDEFKDAWDKMPGADKLHEVVCKLHKGNRDFGMPVRQKKKAGS